MLESRHLILPFTVLFIFFILNVNAMSAEGRSDLGRAYFTGEKAFANEGAPCLACHNMAGFGMAAGANYGPDLTQLYDSYGSEGVEAVLESLLFPSMEAIYSSKPLNEQEQADLAAFFQQAAQLSVIPNSKKLAFQVVIGVLILFGLGFFVGLRRMRAIRQPLIDKQRKIIGKGGLS